MVRPLPSNVKCPAQGAIEPIVIQPFDLERRGKSPGIERGDLTICRVTQRSIARLDCELGAGPESRTLDRGLAEIGSTAPIAAARLEPITAGRLCFKLRHREARRQTAHVEILERPGKRIRQRPALASQTETRRAWSRAPHTRRRWRRTSDCSRRRCLAQRRWQPDNRNPPHVALRT